MVKGAPTERTENDGAETVMCTPEPKPTTPPEFEEDGITHAAASAQIHVDAQGRVRQVNILNTTPISYKRQITREVTRALLQWHCNGGVGERTATVPIRFVSQGQ